MASAEKEPLVAFRRDLYATFSSWGDALFELCDAVLCAAGPVTSLPALSLEPEFRRSHGWLYKALSEGAIDEEALRSLLVANRPAEWHSASQRSTVDASTAKTAGWSGWGSPRARRSSTRRRAPSSSRRH